MTTTIHTNVLATEIHGNVCLRSKPEKKDSVQPEKLEPRSNAIKGALLAFFYVWQFCFIVAN